MSILAVERLLQISSLPEMSLARMVGQNAATQEADRVFY